jgi:hypothetical protein
MRMKYILLLFLFLINIVLANAETTLKQEYSDVENLYLNVSNATFLAQLSALKTSTPDEKAFVGYYKAKINANPSMSMSDLIKNGDLYTKTEYGQKSCLDAGIMYFLQRDMDRALVYLSKITLPSLTEKDYWLAQIYLKQNSNDKAIQSAQSYLRNASDSDKIENTYYVIANAYINQGKYADVQTLLIKLDKIKNLPQHKVYYNYLRGYAYDLANNDAQALDYYKSVFSLDRYCQYAFLTEERLFLMKSRKKNHLDISFIYPDSVYHPAPELPDTAKTIVVTLPMPGIDPPIETVPDSITMVKKTGHGIFLQLGRFTSEPNAQKLMLELKDDNFDAFYFLSKLDGKITYRVLMGPYKTKTAAEKMKSKLIAKTYGSVIVTR